MKQFILFLSFGILIIIALPLFWLKILQWAFLDNTAIIAEGISLVGAILGGTISGALTLIGVRITIKDSKEKQIQDSLPQKLLDIEDIIFIMERQNELLLKSFLKEQSKSALNSHYRERINYIIEYLEKDGLLRKSANVNLKTYQVIRRLFSSLKKLEQNRALGSLYPFESINTAMATTIADLKTECKKLTELIGE
ncbi:hypothetical protein [Solibacillus daqui]|uniref:hypothetical protein n=1 Tax=Solibacillus daqui TaxID=2912187 RepID=UPI002365E765|nr:hypothetical protein [Solibacillus daqui]